MKPFYLIDASIYVFRAWHSMPESLTDRHGNPVNAVYGFANFLLQLLDRERPGHIVALFDESLTSSFRNRIYPDYKANRESAPDDLLYQFRLCRRLCRAFGMHQMASKRYEADDLIGSLATKFRTRQHPAVIVTRDKDLAQLLKPGDTLWDFADDRRLGIDDVSDVFGVGADQIIDFLAIAGDAVDNIPGVPGIGKKTAQQLLAEFGNLDSLYRNLHTIEQMPLRGAARIRALLEQHHAQALLSQSLTRIKCDINLKLTRKDMRWQPDSARARRYFKQLGFGTRLAERFDRMLEAQT